MTHRPKNRSTACVIKRAKERRGPASPRRAAFTLLEVLTVIGIIATLAAIVAVAFNVVGNNAAARRTRVAMETCESLQSAYESAASLPIGMKTTLVSAIDLNSGVSPGLDSTAKLAFLMRTVPANQAIEDKLSNTSVENITWASTTTWTSGTTYAKGDDVISAGTSYIARNAITNSTIAPATDTGNWIAVVQPLLVPKDGWDKGMRFVGGGLQNVQADPNGTKGWYGTNALKPAGFTSLGNSLHSQNGRPFWVSAGPDGDFSTQDDNVYSFEN